MKYLKLRKMLQESEALNEQYDKQLLEATQEVMRLKGFKDDVKVSITFKNEKGWLTKEFFGARDEFTFDTKADDRNLIISDRKGMRSIIHLMDSEMYWIDFEELPVEVKPKKKSE